MTLKEYLEQLKQTFVEDITGNKTCNNCKRTLMYEINLIDSFLKMIQDHGSIAEISIIKTILVRGSKKWCITECSLAKFFDIVISH